MTAEQGNGHHSIKTSSSVISANSSNNSEVDGVKNKSDTPIGSITNNGWAPYYSSFLNLLTITFYQREEALALLAMFPLLVLAFLTPLTVPLAIVFGVIVVSKDKTNKFNHSLVVGIIFV
jgi:hypothetical protein